MILCNDDCTTICDFCVYFQDSHMLTEECDGICSRTGGETYATSTCESFHCIRVKVT